MVGCSIVVPMTNWILVKVATFCPLHKISTNDRKKQIRATPKIAGENF